MTAVPGAPAPRRLLLSSEGPFAALAFIAVGLRLMGTLWVRTWQLWGAKTADHRCIIIRTSPPRFQIVIFPRFVGNSERISFCNRLQIPCRLAVPGPIDRLNCGQFGANSAEICGFLSQRFAVHAFATCRRNALPNVEVRSLPVPGWLGWKRHICNGSLHGRHDHRRAPL